MGIKNSDHPTEEAFRVVANVPAISGNYASERITFGIVPAGIARQSYMAITAMVEDGLAGATLELWLPRVAVAGQDASTLTDAQYFFSQKSLNAATSIAETWPLAGYPGAQIRIKSGGSAGALAINATAF